MLGQRLAHGDAGLEVDNDLLEPVGHELGVFGESLHWPESAAVLRLRRGCDERPCSVQDVPEVPEVPEVEELEVSLGDPGASSGGGITRWRTIPIETALDNLDLTGLWAVRRRFSGGR